MINTEQYDQFSSDLSYLIDNLPEPNSVEEILFEVLIELVCEYEDHKYKGTVWE